MLLYATFRPSGSISKLASALYGLACMCSVESGKGRSLPLHLRVQWLGHSYYRTVTLSMGLLGRAAPILQRAELLELLNSIVSASQACMSGLLRWSVQQVQRHGGRSLVP